VKRRQVKGKAVAAARAAGSSEPHFITSARDDVAHLFTRMTSAEFHDEFTTDVLEDDASRLATCIITLLALEFTRLAPTPPPATVDWSLPITGRAARFIALAFHQRAYWPGVEQ